MLKLRSKIKSNATPIIGTAVVLTILIGAMPGYLLVQRISNRHYVNSLRLVERLGGSVTVPREIDPFYGYGSRIVYKNVSSGTIGDEDAKLTAVLAEHGYTPYTSNTIVEIATDADASNIITPVSGVSYLSSDNKGRVLQIGYILDAKYECEKVFPSKDDSCPHVTSLDTVKAYRYKQFNVVYDPKQNGKKLVGTSEFDSWFR